MKKIVAFCLFATMLVCLIGTMSGCSEGRTLFEGNIYSLNEDGESYTFAELGEDYTGTEITVPAEVEGKPVTAIGNAAFAYNFPNLTSVTLPESVTVIDINAFRDCTGLKSVNIPSKVTVIGEQAFMGCSSLESIKLPDDVTTISKSAFSGCEALSSINIPLNVTELGEGAFQDCRKLTTITVPAGVTKIDRFVFAGCESLKTISIPKGVTSIDATWAFDSCTALESIDFGGTKAEWMQASETDESYEWDFLIKCSDGTIDSGLLDE